MVNPPKFTQEPPSYLKDLPEPSDDDYWDRIKRDFEDNRVIIESVRQETRKDAIGIRKSRERWQSTSASEFPFVELDPSKEKLKKDPKLGKISIKHHLYILHNDAHDAEYLAEHLAFARSLVDEISDQIEERSASPKLLKQLSAFNYSVGIIVHAWTSEQSDMSGARRSERAKEADTIHRKRWLAHYVLRELKPRRRKAADDAFERLVNRLVFTATQDLTDAEREAVDKKGLSWFSAYLDIEDIAGHEDGCLSDTYRQKHIKKAELEKLRQQSTAGLPSLDLEIPKS
jgi:hypothetical protein